jgi:hypothetical protein
MPLDASNDWRGVNRSCRRSIFGSVERPAFPPLTPFPNVLAPISEDILAGRRLELLNRFDDVVADDRRVAPDWASCMSAPKAAPMSSCQPALGVFFGATRCLDDAERNELRND